MSDLKEITAERFDEMLNILPPMNWRQADTYEQKFNRIPETFMMSEFIDGTRTTQFAALDGEFYEKTVDVADRSTWITGKEIDGPDNQLSADQRIEAWRLDPVRRARDGVS